MSNRTMSQAERGAADSGGLVNGRELLSARVQLRSVVRREGSSTPRFSRLLDHAPARNPDVRSAADSVKSFMNSVALSQLGSENVKSLGASSHERKCSPVPCERSCADRCICACDWESLSLTRIGQRGAPRVSTRRPCRKSLNSRPGPSVPTPCIRGGLGPRVCGNRHSDRSRILQFPHALR